LRDLDPCPSPSTCEGSDPSTHGDIPGGDAGADDLSSMPAMTALHRDNLGETSCNVHRADADPASKVRGEISVIFGSQVS